MNATQWINKLNQDARALLALDMREVEAIDTEPATNSCLLAADRAGLVLVASDADAEPQEYERRVYRTPDGALVNLWMDGPESEGQTRIGEGGVGFDDQTDWWDMEQAGEV